MFGHIFPTQNLDGFYQVFKGAPFGNDNAKKNRQAEMDVLAVANRIPPKPPRPEKFSQPGGQTVEGLYEVALKSKPEFDAKIAGLAKGLNAEVSKDFDSAMADFASGKTGTTVIMGPVKGQKRVEEKAWDYAKENGGKPDFTQIGDILRCTVAVDHVDDFDKAFEGLQKQGFSFGREPKIRMTKPTSAGYHDVMINATLSTGHVVEVQVNTKKMLLAKSEAHAHYEKQRTIEGRAVKENRPPTKEEQSELDSLIKVQKKIYAKAWKDSGG